MRSPRHEVFAEKAAMRLYLPLGQAASRNIYLHVKASPSVVPDLILGVVRRELQALDPQNPATSVRLLRDVVGKNINAALLDLAAIAFGAFGAL